MTDELTILNIVAVSYSGSTWANFLLGAHSAAFSVGEIDHIDKTGAALCTLHGESCSVWSHFDQDSNENPYQQIARLADRRVLVVNNAMRLLDKQIAPHVTRKFIWIIRDGRAVVASIRRKYPERSLLKACRQWKRAMAKKQALIDAQPRQDVMRIKYEDFQKNTESTLRAICTFADMTFEPSMLEYWNADLHFIGGNPGAVYSVAKEKKIENVHYRLKDKTQLDLAINTPTLQIKDNLKVDLDHYNTSDPATFRDERWKTELSDNALRVFALSAGRLNRKFGYPASLDRS